MTATANRIDRLKLVCVTRRDVTPDGAHCDARGCSTPFAPGERVYEDPHTGERFCSLLCADLHLPDSTLPRIPELGDKLPRLGW